MTDVFSGVTGPVVLTGSTDGYPVIPSTTPLTRLNFFEGRLLRGTDLSTEQRAGLELSYALGRTGGPGVAYGFDVQRSGETLTVTPGLAVDPRGRVLLLTDPVTVSVATLLAARGGSRQQANGQAVAGQPGNGGEFTPCEVRTEHTEVASVAGTALYLLTVGWIEGLCGNAEIFGAGCETACVRPTDRPYRIDGIVLRLRPWQPQAPLPDSTTVLLTTAHLRSRVAAAYFAEERAAGGPLLSAAVLASSMWCRGATAPLGSEVELALLGQVGDTTVFLDEWTARRERVQPPARVFFDTRISARPRGVFAAQISQFQCQLAEAITRTLPASSGRVLIDAGIIELPAAGYLPVDPARDVGAQAQALLGDGVELRFLPVPVDQVPHEVESVQHRDRIPLLAGLDDPSKRVSVDVLVPDGVPATAPVRDGRAFVVQGTLGDPDNRLELSGSARFDPRPGGGFTLAAAGLAAVSSQQGAASFVTGLAGAVSGGGMGSVTVPTAARVPIDLRALRSVAEEAGLHAIRARSDLANAQLFAGRFTREDAKPLVLRASLTVDTDPWQLPPGGTCVVISELDVYAPVGTPASSSFDLLGRLQPAVGSTDDTRRFRFTGQLTVQQGGRPGQPQAITLDAEVTRIDLPGGLSVQARIVDGPVATLRIRGGATTLTIGDVLTLRLTEDPNPLAAAADPAHDDPANDDPVERADIALRLLRGARFADPEFYEQAKLATFGADAGTPVTTVRASRDWIAFRRRAVEPAPPPAPVTRPVAVWVAAATSADKAAGFEKLLRIGQTDGLRLQRVDTVLFRAETAQMTSSADELRVAYQATGAPPVLRFVGYAPPDMPAGRPRAQAVLSALNPLLSADPQTGIDALANPLPGYVDPATDGSQFLVVYPKPQVRTATLQIVALNPDANPPITKAAETALRLNDSTTFQRFIQRGVVQQVATVTITDDQPDPAQVKAATQQISGVVQGMNVELDVTPLLWIDLGWASTEPSTVSVMTDTAESVTAAVQGQRSPPLLSLQGVRTVSLDVTARHGLLVFFYYVVIT